MIVKNDQTKSEENDVRLPVLQACSSRDAMAHMKQAYSCRCASAKLACSML
eukprot:CAMPEP_0195567796 /NCGR_PEP_ID=MMETSP0814-20130614/1857_1 /TAXON_ID=97485 /ORGANISM="Prymnesium parvum, Strain Texoma1" /LENGTH=50 /DNA_ID=CAMNT_0040703023 /DNA_START=341 /DNA_END=493 /DNA_ORIENTATION=-